MSYISQPKYLNTSPAIRGFAHNLVLRTASATTIAYSWDEITLKDSNGYYKTFGADSGTITITNAGVDGLDTGSMAASTLYYVTIIGKDDGTSAAIIHLASGTLHGPSQPAGYTWAWTVSFFYSNGSSQINLFWQKGNHWLLEEGITAGVMRPLASTTPANTNWATQACSTYIPAGFGRMEVGFEGFMSNGTVGTVSYLSLAGGDSTLANSVNGKLSSWGIGGENVRVILRTHVMTDGSANQNIKYKISFRDGNQSVQADIWDAYIPTVVAGS